MFAGKDVAGATLGIVGMGEIGQAVARRATGFGMKLMGWTRSGREVEYMSLLANHFNPATLDHLMCRSMISVDHAGRLFDCDFNLALGIATPGSERTIWDVTNLSTLAGREIATGSHCLGCTAGAGSSCGGALIEPIRSEGHGVRASA